MDRCEDGKYGSDGKDVKTSRSVRLAGSNATSTNLLFSAAMFRLHNPTTGAVVSVSETLLATIPWILTESSVS